MESLHTGTATTSPTCLDLIRRGARQHAARTAIAFGDRSMTFADVNRLSNRFAHALHAAGVTHGKRVALLLNNGLYSVPLDFGCVKAGANRVPLNARLSANEHARMIQDSGCTHLIYAPDLEERAQALQAAVPGLVCLALGTPFSGARAFLAEAERMPDSDPNVDVRPDDVILTLFTSGTTGTLKAAQHTQASYAAICRNVLLNLIDVRPDDAMLHAASLIHASGIFVLPFWLRGGRTVILPGFEPGQYLKAIENERITALNMVPTMMQALFDHPDIAKTDVSSLRQVIYGASPMPRAVITRAMAAWGRERFWQYYGQTEAPLCIAVLRPEDHEGELLGACGQPALDVELKLVDGEGRTVPPGTPGEIMIRAPFAIAGYHNAPELNAATFEADGWIRTRDIGEFDARGFLYLRDRTSDMIITGGYNVYPLEVENALLTHPAVRECAVIGLPHEKWVESVTAVVVLRPGMEASEAELIAHVATQVASYKKPQRVIFDTEIPKTAVGKLSRKLVRERHGR
ncbi:long-chain fatty acid--CoA ligase [Oxalobacteraceae bacterium OM1]|nr:long-chain fatty acid--CoA ligase [Oxalobacteraceae bacterium OM1]